MVRLLAAASLTVALASPAAAQTTKRFFPYPYQTTTLPNGLTVVRVPFNSPGLVAYYTVVRVGSRNEVEPGYTGFAHFFEHMMFKGTPSQPEGQRESQLGKLGFNENAFTTDDITVYHVVGPTSGLQTLVQLEADRFQNLSYAEPVFQTEAKAVLGEYHKNAANPRLKIDEALSATAFTKHTYQHTTLGFYEDIQKMPQYYEYSKSFFQRWYTPDNTMLFIVGDFDDAKLMEWVTGAYGNWAGVAAQLEIPQEPVQSAERKVHLEWPTATLPRHLHAWRTPAGFKSAAIQNVLGAYMAGPTSPMYKELVLENQLVQSVGSEYSDHRDPTLFILSATLKEEAHRTSVKQAFDRSVKEVVSGKIDPKRVQDIKDNLRYGLLMSLETPNEVALNLGYYAGLYGSPDALDQLYQAIEQVTPADLIAFVKEHFTAKKRTILTFTPMQPPSTAEGK